MTSENKIYQAYLEEMQQIEKFRSSHISMYGETPVDTEDPYTKRLIESLAFFGARARLQGTEKIVQIHQCLFRQYFPYLINSIPTFGMLQMKPSIRFPEKVFLPVGSELIFKTKNNLKAIFQTLDDITVFPFSIKSFDFARRGEEGWQFAMEFTSPHISTDEIGSMKLYINHLNSFLSSLSVSFALQSTLEKVHVFYDDGKEKNANGKDCTIQYGYNSRTRKVFSHVVEQLRSLLHFPQQELFISLEIPPSGKRWKSFTLTFDLGDKWPENLKLNAESFIPYVVPIVNLKKAYAEPVFDDGTKDNYPILYPEPMHKFELHTVLNVSEILANGTKPIIPGLLGIQGEGSFEVDYFKNEIILNLPNAFNNPKTVTIEALWTQPWFSNYINDELELIFTEAQTLGINVRLLGSIHRYENTLEDDPNFLIRILSLKNQNRLTTNEIIFIMNVMKNLNNSYFDSVPPLIKDLKINEKFNHQQMNALIEYEFFLKDLGGQRWELVLLFFKYVNDLLNCWLSSFEIETKVHFPRHKKPIIFKGEQKMYYLYWQEISYFLNELDKERVIFEKSPMNADSMENARAKMASTVEVMKSSLEQRMDKYHASLIIFPIVAAIDEKMQGYDFNSNKIKWAPLQKDFYAAYNAGEIFFKSLDEILDDPTIPNIVFQVYYAMLKRGFQGKYKDSKTQIAKYLDMLKDKIPVAAQIKNKAPINLPSAKQKKSWLKKWHCYSLSLVMALATFVLLTLFAKFQ